MSNSIFLLAKDLLKILAVLSAESDKISAVYFFIYNDVSVYNMIFVEFEKVGLNKNSDEILVTSKNLITLDRLKLFEKFSHLRPIHLVLFTYQKKVKITVLSQIFR